MSSIHVLTACVLAVLVVPALAGLHARSLGTPIQGSTNNDDSSMNRLKVAALASIMYASDYDGVLPYVQKTASAVEVFQPYAKTKKVFQSATPGGQFVFNLNVAGVNVSAISRPAETPLWIETIAKHEGPLYVAFLDGHVAKTDQATVKASSAWRFARAKNMKPLPANYLLNQRNTGSSLTTAPAKRG